MNFTLREVMKKKKTMAVPGVFNAITARLAESIGFQALYVSGAGLSNGVLGMPDVGLITLKELSQQVQYMRAVVKVPLIVDADTGFGGPSQVKKTVQELERSGASAIQIEDQTLDKKCGHLSGKKLIKASDMAKKIRAAASARKKKDFLIIARTDARGVTSLEDAIERALLYLKAGADIIFPEALKSKAEFKKFALEVRAPLLANMTEFGKSPYISVQEFKTLGYDLVIFPMTAFRMALRAAQKGLLEIHHRGTQVRLISKMQTRKELYDLMGCKI